MTTTATVHRMPLRVYPEALERWRAERDRLADGIFAPRSRLTLSKYADEHRQLSADLGEPGQWRTSRIPYMRRPMDAITDLRVRTVSIQKSARIGATQSVVVNAIHYYVDEEPSPIIVALPTIDDAKRFSTQLLQPSIDDTPRLASRIADVHGKKRRASMLEKSFPGGALQIIGVQSPRALRMVHGRIILASEIDAWKLSAGKEGNPRKLLEKRAGAYGSPKFIFESTPLILEDSHIVPIVESGSQEFYEVPCPHCGEFQTLEWGSPDVDYGIKWTNRRPETAIYVCKPSGCVIEEESKFEIVAAGKWAALHPEREDHLSFYLNALVSPFDGARWSLLVKEWLEAQRKPEDLKVFVNTVLGQPYMRDAVSVEPDLLEKRIEPYPCDCVRGKHEARTCTTRKIPRAAAVLVRWTDTQGDRLETGVWAFGAGEEAWPIEFEIIPGDPSLPETHPNSPWAELARQEARTYLHESGVRLKPVVSGVDSGGHHSKQVYAYTKARVAQRVYATKGANVDSAPVLSKPSRNNSYRVILYMLGVFAAKEAIMARFAKIDTPGPGYIHIPDWIDREQMNQLVAEKLVNEVKGGRAKRVWTKESGARNEQLDIFVGCLCILQVLGVARIKNLGDEAEAHWRAGEKLRAEAEGKGATPKPDEPERPGRSSFRDGRSRGGWGNRG